MGDLSSECEVDFLKWRQMCQVLEGYKKIGEEKVYNLKKALVLLKQAPKAWHLKLGKSLTSSVLSKSEFEPAVNFKYAREFI